MENNQQNNALYCYSPVVTDNYAYYYYTLPHLKNWHGIPQQNLAPLDENQDALSCSINYLNNSDLVNNIVPMPMPMPGYSIYIEPVVTPKNGYIKGPKGNIFII